MTVKTSVEVSYSYYEAIKPGAPAQIRFLPDAPQQVLVDSVHETRELGELWLVLLFLLGCALYPLLGKLLRGGEGESEGQQSTESSPALPPQSIASVAVPRWLSASSS